MRTTKGSALITAIFVMSLVAIAAMAMTLRLRIDIKRSQLSENQVRRLHLFQTQATTAILNLQNKLKNNHNFLSPYNIEKVTTSQGTLTGDVVDAESLFNINQFFANNPKSFAEFKRLLKLADQSIADGEASDILAMIMKQTVKRGKEFYLSPNELSDAFGDHFDMVRPYLIALPSAKVGLHPLGSPAILLSAHFPQLDYYAAQNISKNSTRMTNQERMQMFQQLGIKLEEKSLKPTYILVTLHYKDQNRQNFVYKKTYQIEAKLIKIISENWF